MNIPTLKSALSKVRLSHLKDIINHLDKDVSLYSKARLLKRIPQLLDNRKFLSELIDGLNENSRTWLKLVTMIESLTPEGLFILYGELEDGLLELYNMGLLYVNEDDKYLYIPQQLHNNLVEIFSGLGVSENGYEKVKGVSVGVGISLIRDIFLILKYADENELKITQEGKIYKRCMRNLEKLLGDFRVIGESIFDDVTDRLRFLINYLSKVRIFKLRKNVLEIDDDNCIEWYRNSAFNRLNGILEYYEDDIIKRDISYWVVKSSIGQLNSDNWYKISDYVEEIKGLLLNIKDANSRMVEVLIKSNLFSLYNFGLLDMTISDNGKPKHFKPNDNYFALIEGEEDGFVVEESDEITIQADFTVIARRDLCLNLRQEMERFLWIERMDEMIHYKMDKESVYRAMISGMSYEDIMGMLIKHSVKEPPQNIIYTLQKWGSQYANIKFFEGVIINTDSDKIAEEVKMMLDDREINYRDIPKRSIVLDREDYEGVYDLLLEMDYLPKPLIIDKEEEEKQVSVRVEEDIETVDRNNTMMVLKKAISEEFNIMVRVESDDNDWEGWVEPIKLVDEGGEFSLKYKRLDSIVEEKEMIENIVYISW